MGFFSFLKNFQDDFYANPNLSLNCPSNDGIKQGLDALILWLNPYIVTSQTNFKISSHSQLKSFPLNTRPTAFIQKTPLDLAKEKFITKYSNTRFVIPQIKFEEFTSRCEALKSEIEKMQYTILSIPHIAAARPHMIGDAEKYRQISGMLYSEWLDIVAEYEIVMSKCSVS